MIPLSHRQPSPAVLTGVKNTLPATDSGWVRRADPSLEALWNPVQLHSPVSKSGSKGIYLPLTWKNQVAHRAQEKSSSNPTADTDPSEGLTISNTLWDNGLTHLPLQAYQILLASTQHLES